MNCSLVAQKTKKFIQCFYHFIKKLFKYLVTFYSADQRAKSIMTQYSPYLKINPLYFLVCKKKAGRL